MKPESVGAFFGVQVIDYGRRSNGILLSSGAGIMMAVMDAALQYRWCIDLDTMRAHRARVANFIVALDLNTEINLIGAVGWFSLDDPRPIVEGLARCRRAQVVSYLAMTDGGTCLTLEQFIAKGGGRGDVPLPAPHHRRSLATTSSGGLNSPI